MTVSFNLDACRPTRVQEAMTATPIPKFKSDRPFTSPEAAARELLRIYREFIAAKPDIPHTYTGITNSAFTDAGGSVAEYGAGRDFGIAQNWFRIDESGTRVYLLPEGKDA